MFQKEIQIREHPISAETTRASRSDAWEVHHRAHYVLDHETRAPVAEVLVPPHEVTNIKVDELIDHILIGQNEQLRLEITGDSISFSTYFSVLNLDYRHDLDTPMILYQIQEFASEVHRK